MRTATPLKTMEVVLTFQLPDRVLAMPGSPRTTSTLDEEDSIQQNIKPGLPSTQVKKTYSNNRLP